MPNRLQATRDFKKRLAKWPHYQCPAHEFDYYYKACRKGDLEAKAVAVNPSVARVLADASEITGLPRDNFEVREISKAEFETLPREPAVVSEA